MTPAEVDLVLLAGLPDEHEGLAATFRRAAPARRRPTRAWVSPRCSASRPG